MQKTSTVVVYLNNNNNKLSSNGKQVCAANAKYKSIIPEKDRLRVKYFTLALHILWKSSSFVETNRIL